MSILIKGIKMPTNCDDCLLDFDCPHDQSIDGYKMQGGRPCTCPLVHIPPHGRCIDADALIKELAIDDLNDHNGATLLMAVFLEVLKAAPTIIPADESNMDSFIRIFEEDDKEDGMDSFIYMFEEDNEEDEMDSFIRIFKD